MWQMNSKIIHWPSLSSLSELGIILQKRMGFNLIFLMDILVEMEPSKVFMQ